MWCEFNKSSITVATACLIATSIVVVDTTFAAQTYTPRQFRSVLRGLGYEVKLSDAPLTDTATRNAILAFQKGYNIEPADGVAGPKTQDFAARIVEILQANLNLVTNPNPPLPRNQYYGSQTEAAVRQYQKKLGVKETGIADLALRQQLDQAARDLLNKPSPEPTATPTTTPTPEATPTTTPTPEATPTTTPTPEATPRPQS
ncbi:MAG: peptidoglycan-binding protein [Scytonema sp. PMC 1069.18]|nr:peptidoglycan-binding protein [Scytonema sp. PMC 1069.18]